MHELARRPRARAQFPMIAAVELFIRAVVGFGAPATVDLGNLAKPLSNSVRSACLGSANGRALGMTAMFLVGSIRNRYLARPARRGCRRSAVGAVSVFHEAEPHFLTMPEELGVA